MAKTTYKISGMHCTSCAMNIEWTLEDLGLKSKCDYARQVLEIESDKPVDLPAVKKAVSALGYQISEGQ